MQIDKGDIKSAKKGESIGIKISNAKKGSLIYKIVKKG